MSRFVSLRVLTAIFALVFSAAGCANMEKLASPDIDGCNAAIKIKPHRPRAGFPSVIEVSLACAGAEAGVLGKNAVVKVFSEGQRDIQVLEAAMEQDGGVFAAPVVFAFGGRYHVTFDTNVGKMDVHRLFFVTVEGPEEPGGE